MFVVSCCFIRGRGCNRISRYASFRNEILLARIAHIRWPFASREIAAPRIDIKSAPARIASIDGKFLRFASAQQIHEDPLNAMLVKFVMVAKANYIFQQSFLVDRSA